MARTVDFALLFTFAVAASACGEEVSAPRPTIAGSAEPGAYDEASPDPWDGVRPSADWAVPVLADHEPEYEALFALGTMKTLELGFSLAEWDALLGDYDAYSRNELSRTATLAISLGTSTAGAVVLPRVGVRVRGNAFSRERPESGEGPHDPARPLRRAHLKIELDETFDGDESVYGSPEIPTATASAGRTFHGVRALNLKVNRDDPSYLHEVASYELLRRAGVLAPRAAFARLFVKIGDEPRRYLGVYVMIEDVDATWIRRRFSGQSSTLFKCLWQRLGPADLAEADTDGDMTRGKIGIERTDPRSPAEAATWSDRSSYRPSYDLKTNRAHALDAATALNALITQLAARPTQQEVRAAIDVEALLRAQVVTAFVGMSDDYWRNGNNYYLLQRPDDQRWMYVPYDFDRTFGVPTSGPDEATSSFLRWGAGGNAMAAPLVSRPLRSPQLTTNHLAYVAHLVAAGDAPFAWHQLAPLFTELQALIEPHVTGYDGDNPYPYDPDLSAIEAFVAARARVARAETTR